MFKKRILPVIIAAAIVVAAVFGGRYAWGKLRSGSREVEVTSVSELNWGYWGDEMTSSGMVTNDSSQEVVLSDGDVIKEVLVEEGQTVTKGTPLVSIDMTGEELQLEIKQLGVQQILNDIAIEQKNLQKLRTTVPVEPEPDPPPELEPEPEPEPEPDPEPEDPLAGIDEKSGDAYQYITTSAKAFEGDGSEEKPFRFLCTKDAFVMGSYFNYLSENEYFAAFEVHKGNKKDGKLIYSWEVNGKSLPQISDETARWAIKTRQEIVAPEPEPEPEPAPEPDPEPELDDLELDDEMSGVTYTAQELAEAIADSEEKLTRLDFDRRKAELEVSQMMEKIESGTITAKIDGVVSKINDEETVKNEGVPLIQLTGSEGLFVRGSISELMLGEVKIGQSVRATSWESSRTFEAKITEISEYPSTNNSYNGTGNPNVSYYDYTAYIEDTEGLVNGEYLDLALTTGSEDNGGIYLEKAYVREENGNSYVMKAKDGVLVKQYVETGKIIYGEAIEIKKGLTEDDMIAFPYGDGAKEGAAVSQDGEMDEIGEMGGMEEW